LLALHGEILDFRRPVLWRHRAGEANVYIHFGHVRQGHTERGQVLGSEVGLMSSQGLVLALERYSRAGRSRLSWNSVVRADAPAAETRPDVQHVARLEHGFFWRTLELTAGLGGIYEFNRDAQGSDAKSLIASLGVSWRP